MQQANDLAILLRAGALPAKLTPIEQRVVGAGLGQDSIDKGKLASYVGAALVLVFMFVTYGLFGLFANIAVGVNVAMIFGVLSLLNATLTLPGICGIVLTGNLRPSDATLKIISELPFPVLLAADDISLFARDESQPVHVVGSVVSPGDVTVVGTPQAGECRARIANPFSSSLRVD